MNSRPFLLLALLVSGCSVQERKTGSSGGNSKAPVANGNDSARSEGGTTEKPVDSPAVKLSGEVIADGSSTVFPITQAVAEEFMKIHTDVKVSVGIAGTGGGFKRFVAGETDISDASRPISEKEIDACKKNGIEYVELKVAIDGLSVVVNPKNNWCKAMTVAQLKALWSPGNQVKKWKELDPTWPNEEIRLYGPGPDSGTFDYFTEAIVGKAKQSRTDYTYNSDDNILVQGVAGDKYSLGYFGYAYYVANKNKLKVVKIAAGDDLAEAVAPNEETILSGTYKPLSRPLFVYANKASLKKPQVAAFLKFLLNDGQKCVKESGYIQLPEAELAESRQRLDEALSK